MGGSRLLRTLTAVCISAKKSDDIATRRRPVFRSMNGTCVIPSSMATKLRHLRVSAEEVASSSKEFPLEKLENWGVSLGDVESSLVRRGEYCDKVSRGLA